MGTKLNALVVAAGLFPQLSFSVQSEVTIVSSVLYESNVNNFDVFLNNDSFDSVALSSNNGASSTDIGVSYFLQGQSQVTL
jgi:hypothetical protein